MKKLLTLAILFLAFPVSASTIATMATCEQDFLMTQGTNADKASQSTTESATLGQVSFWLKGSLSNNLLVTVEGGTTSPNGTPVASCEIDKTTIEGTYSWGTCVLDTPIDISTKKWVVVKPQSGDAVTLCYNDGSPNEYANGEQNLFYGGIWQGDGVTYGTDVTFLFETAPDPTPTPTPTPEPTEEATTTLATIHDDIFYFYDFLLYLYTIICAVGGYRLGYIVGRKYV